MHLISTQKTLSGAARLMYDLVEDLVEGSGARENGLVDECLVQESGVRKLEPDKQRRDLLDTGSSSLN